MLSGFILKRNKQNGGWDPQNQIGDVVKRFARKSEAKAGSMLARNVKRGTLRIHNKDGRIEEERRFPRSADPRSHPG